MTIIWRLWTISWKTLLIVAAALVGVMGAMQAGWSVTELLVTSSLMGGIEASATRFAAGLGFVMLIGSIYIINAFANKVLWLALPIFLYISGVQAWNGFVSDFDYTRGKAIQYRYANAYVLNDMSQRGRYLSCHDERIDLTDDAKAVCAGLIDVGPGVYIPGSEHKCGFLGMFTCFYSGREDPKSGN